MYERLAAGSGAYFWTDDVDDRVKLPLARSRAGGPRAMLMHRIQADSAFAAGDAQQSSVVHGVEQVGGGV